MSESAEYVREFLKANDKDRYYASLFLPQESQAHIQALYAFSADIAQVRARISEPAAGEIRLQWWHDFLEGTEHGDASSNPLAAQLNRAIEAYDLPTTPLRRLIAARRFDLYDDPMRDLHSFEGYAGETSAILYHFACLIVNGGNDAGTADISGHMGVAQMLIDQLYALPITSKRAQIVLPLDILNVNGVSQQSIFAQQATSEVISATSQLREVAGEHLHKVQNLLADTKPVCRSVFVHICNLDARLKRLDQFAELPFAPPPDDPDWKRLARMAIWAFRSGR